MTDNTNNEQPTKTTTTTVVEPGPISKFFSYIAHSKPIKIGAATIAIGGASFFAWQKLRDGDLEGVAEEGEKIAAAFSSILA